jgi:hypothetical protein
MVDLRWWKEVESGMQAGTFNESQGASGTWPPAVGSGCNIQDQLNRSIMLKTRGQDRTVSLKN